MSDFNLKILGVRGSKPICNNKFLKYGGNTFCVEIMVNGFCMVFDAGTGISNLESNEVHNEIHLFFTHYHIDHFMGLYYLKQLYDKNKKVHFYGFSHSNDFNSELDLIFSPVIFPLSLDMLPAQKVIHTIGVGESMSFDRDIKVETFKVNHPGGCISYTVSYRGKKVCICTDTGPMKGEQLRGFCKFADHSDYLIYDSYFLPDELIESWGHSSYREALEILGNCHIGRVLLTHFSEMDDEALERLQNKLLFIDNRLTLCREGMSVDL